MRDVVSYIGSLYTGLASLPSITSSQVSPWVDLSGFDGAAIQIFAGTYTSGTLTPVIEESDDQSTVNTVATTDLVAWSATSPTDHTPVHVGGAQPTAISSAATAINWRVGYIGNKRYIRLNSTSSSANLLFDAAIVAGRPRLMPSAV
jgi:hypothetical protein